VVVGRGGEVELGEDGPHVRLDGLVRDEEGVCDGLVGASLGHQGQDVHFSLAEGSSGLRRRERPTSMATIVGSTTSRPALIWRIALLSSSMSPTRSLSRLATPSRNGTASSASVMRMAVSR
jgi:hypothetical protein